ncbi:MAG TPA: hypothetical protein VKY27_05955 [Bacteriovoracaceae bacterium]|nr:hypothetical protein [Bacteriovoracaceae bacterium]
MRKLAILFTFILSTQLYASTQDPYYQISEVQVERIDTSHGMISDKDLGKDIGEVISITRQIIAFGKEIYEIVKAGKPVINTEYAPLSILPVNTEFGQSITPMDLSGWKRPQSAKFKITYKNGYGSEVVSFTYNVNMSPGGKFRGKGAYITNAQIVPETISVAWGFNFNAKMSLVGLTNLGTDDDPIVGATLQLSYTVSTVVKEERNNMTIFISGDGNIEQL